MYYYNFNNFPLTRQRLKTVYFLIFLVLVRTNRFRFPNFVSVAAPSPTPKTAGPRASASPSTPTNFKCLSCLLVWINPGSYFNQFLMPKV